MAVIQSAYIDAPVEKVFDFLKDPRKQFALMPEQRFGVTEVVAPDGGAGTYYGWRGTIAGRSVEGFDVFTEFVPNRRITDRNSSALVGDWTFELEPEGSGTRLIMSRQPRALWSWGPLDRMLLRLQRSRSAKVVANLKTIVEATQTAAAG